MNEPLMYSQLKDWWLFLVPLNSCRDDGHYLRRVFKRYSHGPPGTLLELGCGGGSMASHFADMRLTLSDISQDMLDVSKITNPDAEHVLGDMRTMRLGRMFDIVYANDAICYMTTEEDLRKALTTAAIHCRPGGLVVLKPDFVRETWSEGTVLDDPNGHVEVSRALRCVEWHFDPDPNDTHYELHFAVMLRQGDEVKVVHDHHRFGLFSRKTWFRLLDDVGFTPSLLADKLVFIGHRRES
jgi:ubiquinone/menaquinone biosynthesis C-methylase UbiE